MIGSAQRCAELVVAESALGSRFAVEEVARIHARRCAEIRTPNREDDWSRSGDDVHHRAAVASVLGAELRLQIEFLNRVDGQHRSRRPADAGLVERGVVEERIVVVGTVERVVVGTVAAAVDGELPEAALDARHAGRFDRRARHQGDQFAEVASVQRQVGYQLLVHHFAQHVARVVDQRRFLR